MKNKNNDNDTWKESFAMSLLKQVLSHSKTWDIGEMLFHYTFTYTQKSGRVLMICFSLFTTKLCSLSYLLHAEFHGLC